MTMTAMPRPQPPEPAAATTASTKPDGPAISRQRLGTTLRDGSLDRIRLGWPHHDQSAAARPRGASQRRLGRRGRTRAVLRVLRAGGRRRWLAAVDRAVRTRPRAGPA